MNPAELNALAALLNALPKELHPVLMSLLKNAHLDGQADALKVVNRIKQEELNQK